MGMAMGGGGAGKRGRRRGAPAVMNEINMTPFIDVMLVLLIIFMVAAPMMTVGVPIDMPETQARSMEGQTKPITVTINAKGQVFVQDDEVTADTVVSKVQALARQGGDERILIRGDRTADYGLIMSVMGRINAAGFKKIGLLTKQETASR